MILVMLYVAVLVAGLWPRSDAGRVLRRLMVELPGAALGWFTPGKLLLLLGLALAVAALAVAARGDLVMFAAQGLPEGVAWMVSLDVAAYLDVIALAWLLAVTVRLRAAMQALRTGLSRVRQGPARRVGARARSSRRVARKAEPKSGDEDGGWAWA